MDRRRVVIAGALLVGCACTSTRSLEIDADVDAVKRVIAEYYDTFFRNVDEHKYRMLLTDDYRLLENGEILGVEDDLKGLPKPEDELKRTDAFDFKSVNVRGDTAYAFYFLRADVTDKLKGHRNLEWLESAILARAGGTWKVALLHSTKIHDQ